MGCAQSCLAGCMRSVGRRLESPGVEPPTGGKSPHALSHSTTIHIAKNTSPKIYRSQKILILKIKYCYDFILQSGNHTFKCIKICIL